MPMELPRHNSTTHYQHGSGPHTLEEQEGASCWLGSPGSWSVTRPLFWYIPVNPVGRLFSDVMRLGAWRWASQCPTAAWCWKSVPGAWLPTHQPVSTTCIRCRVLDSLQELLNNASPYPSSWSASSPSATCVVAWRLMTGAL